MADEKIIYLGLFLTPESKEKLLTVLPPELHSNLHLDHVTLVFKPSDEQIMALKPLAGEVVPFTAVEYFWDEKAFAIGVHLPKLPVVTPQHGHITVSTANGVPPKYSTELMENTLPMPMHFIILTGFVDSFPRFLLRKWESKKI